MWRWIQNLCLLPLQRNSAFSVTSTTILCSEDGLCLRAAWRHVQVQPSLRRRLHRPHQRAKWAKAPKVTWTLHSKTVLSTIAPSSWLPRWVSSKDRAISQHDITSLGDFCMQHSMNNLKVNDILCYQDVSKVVTSCSRQRHIPLVLLMLNGKQKSRAVQ